MRRCRGSTCSTAWRKPCGDWGSPDLSCAGLTRLRGRSRFGEAKARASIKRKLVSKGWIAGSSPAMRMHSLSSAPAFRGQDPSAGQSRIMPSRIDGVWMARNRIFAVLASLALRQSSTISLSAASRINSSDTFIAISIAALAAR